MSFDHKPPTRGATQHSYTPIPNGQTLISDLDIDFLRTSSDDAQPEQRPQLSRREWWAVAGIAVFLIGLAAWLVK